MIETNGERERELGKSVLVVQHDDDDDDDSNLNLMERFQFWRSEECGLVGWLVDWCFVLRRINPFWVI